MQRTSVISDPTIIQFLFEISQSLHDGINMLDAESDQQKACLISSFVQMVSNSSSKFPDQKLDITFASPNLVISDFIFLVILMRKK